MPESDNAQHKECVLLLAQCISKLPCLQKKVLAMYYFENMQLAEIATCLGLSKIKACQILIETSATLFLVDSRTPYLTDRQEVVLDQQAESH
jgi:RNA polymerase sigma factor FliA